MSRGLEPPQQPRLTLGSLGGGQEERSTRPLGTVGRQGTGPTWKRQEAALGGRAGVLLVPVTMAVARQYSWAAGEVRTLDACCDAGEVQASSGFLLPVRSGLTPPSRPAPALSGGRM